MRLFFRNIFVPALILLFLTGCGGITDAEPELFGFLDSPASFTAVFPPLDDTAVPVTVKGHLSPDEIVLTVTDPPRSAGLTVRYREGVCTVESGDGIPVPLSEKAAEPLTAFLAVLTGGDSGSTFRKSPDGTETLVGYSGGTLRLDAQNLPAAVDSGTADSDTLMRTIVITEWKQEKPGAAAGEP